MKFSANWTLLLFLLFYLILVNKCEATWSPSENIWIHLLSALVYYIYIMEVNGEMDVQHYLPQNAFISPKFCYELLLLYTLFPFEFGESRG